MASEGVSLSEQLLIATFQEKGLRLGTNLRSLKQWGRSAAGERAEKATNRLEARPSRRRPEVVIWDWICLRWEMEVDLSRRERRGLERTKVWVVFQLVVVVDLDL